MSRISSKADTLAIASGDAVAGNAAVDGGNGNTATAATAADEGSGSTATVMLDDVSFTIGEHGVLKENDEKSIEQYGFLHEISDQLTLENAAYEEDISVLSPGHGRWRFRNRHCDCESSKPCFVVRPMRHHLSQFVGYAKYYCQKKKIEKH